MKLELSLTWNTARPAWRVQSRMFHYGPWCYSRRNAWWEWLKGFDRRPRDEFGLCWAMFILPLLLFVVLWNKATTPFKRAWRWFRYRCVVCGRDCSSLGGFITAGHHYRYCSLECAAYDNALREPKKSRILFGTLKEPKRHFEADMKGGE